LGYPVLGLAKTRAWYGDDVGIDCAPRRAVINILEKLTTEEWISKRSGKRQFNSNVYEVQYQNLPTEQRVATQPSAEALALAVIYRTLFLAHCANYKNSKGRNCHRKLRKDWQTRWSGVIQTLLDAGNTAQFITQMFNWAATNKPKQFRAGPQGLIKLWPKREAK